MSFCQISERRLLHTTQLIIIMTEAKFEKPDIKVSHSGVAYVSAYDILMSRVGRKEIEKVNKFVVPRIKKSTSIHNTQHTNYDPIRTKI